MKPSQFIKLKHSNSQFFQNKTNWIPQFKKSGSQIKFLKTNDQSETFQSNLNLQEEYLPSIGDQRYLNNWESVEDVFNEHEITLRNLD